MCLTFFLVLMPIHAVGSAIVNIVNGKKWNLDLVPDLSVLGFTGGWSLYQFRYCFLFMLVYVGCNAIYVAGLRFIPNSIARKGYRTFRKFSHGHFLTRNLTDFTLQVDGENPN